LVGYFWHAHRLKGLALAFEERAASLESEEQWRDAASYLRRYLRLNPADLDARVRLVQATEHIATTPRQKGQLIGLLYQTLGRLPDRNDLQLKLATHLWDIRDIRAEAEAQKLLDSPTATVAEKRAAERIRVLSRQTRARRGGLVTITQAAGELAAALAESPADVRLAVAMARAYREYPQDVGTILDGLRLSCGLVYGAATISLAPVQPLDAVSSVDTIMDRLVDGDPTNPEALIARYAYQRASRTAENARVDLESVLAEDPNHVEALLLLANEELSLGGAQNLAAAEEKLRKVIELEPLDPRGHRGLAGIQIARGERGQAVETLLLGRKKLASRNLDMEALLVEVLIDLNRLDEAKKLLADFDEEYRKSLPRLPAAGRSWFENNGRMLHARLHIAQNQLDQAIRELTAVVDSVGEAGTAAEGSQALQARTMLAAVQERMGRVDLAAAQWTALSDLEPAYYREAQWRAGAAYLRSGRPEDAIRQLQAYLQSKNASPLALISLVQAHLQQQLLLPPDQQNWQAFSNVLKQAKAQLPQSWELSIAEAEYLHAEGDEEQKRKAVEELERLEAVHSNDPTFLERVVASYQRLGAAEDANRALALYEKCQPNSSRRTLLRLALELQQGEVEEAPKILAAAAAAASGDERDQLLEARIRVLMSSRQLDEAQSAVTEFIDAAPTKTARLILGLEIALMRRDFAAAGRWEEALKNLTTSNSYDWRYYRARRLVGQFASLDAQSRLELESLIGSLRSDRPDWYPAISLSGQHLELTGDRERAIEAYQQAINLGDRRPQTFERLVTALYTEGRYNDANSYLARLGTDVVEVGDSRLESLAISAALRESGPGVALDLAKETVDRGSTDPMHFVWLAQLQKLNGHLPEAEQVLQNAVERYPTDPRVWNALFSNLVETEQFVKARAVLKESTEKVALTDEAKHFALAQGYEQLGEVAAAQEEYRATIAKDSKHIGARLRLGKLLLSSDLAAARQLFEEVLAIDRSNAQAQRFKASILAASGSEEDWESAERLLESSGGASTPEETGADLRVHAILLARRGREREERIGNCREAQRILKERIDKSSAQVTDLDRIILAGLYEQEAALVDDEQSAREAVGNAREVLRPLLDRDKPSADYLVMYARLLLRMVERATGEAVANSVSARQLSMLISDAGRRIDEYEVLVRDDADSESRIVAIALRTRLLCLDNREEEARERLNEFANQHLEAATDDAARAKLLLRLGNIASSSKFPQEAEKWYRQLVAVAPNSYILLAKSLADQNRHDEAVDVCLHAATSRPAAEVATVVAQLLPATHINSALVERVQPLIASALKADGDNVNLLMSIAVRHVTDDRSDEAIKLFRRVLELQPNHTLALNNLATLLAERPDQLAEARKLVERAIGIAGRSPALLDTLGTILIRAGQNEDAVTYLNEAVAGLADDPRFFFHLAVAYQRSGDHEKAHDKLEAARKRGLDAAILTEGDQEMLAALEHELHSSSHSN
jgi:tetratricopeptide (TPR) repeat protein